MTLGFIQIVVHDFASQADLCSTTTCLVEQNGVELAAVPDESWVPRMLPRIHLE